MKWAHIPDPKETVGKVRVREKVRLSNSVPDPRFARDKRGKGWMKRDDGTEISIESAGAVERRSGGFWHCRRRSMGLGGGERTWAHGGTMT